MRKLLSFVVLVLGIHAGAVISVLQLPQFLRHPSTFVSWCERFLPSGFNVQAPPFMSPQLPLPGFGGGSGHDDGNSGDSHEGNLVMTDVMPTARSINIFAGLIRDVDAVFKRVSDPMQNSTIIAPANSAMNELPRKPWEDAADYDKMGAAAYQGASGQDRAQSNLRRFVEAHIVMSSPWKEHEKVKTMGGGELWWLQKDGKKLLQPGDIEVSSEMSTSNGEIWIVKQAIKP